MKVAYLLNTYPMASLTFIRREIEALEARGVTVVRFAVRRWSDRLVDPLDIAEADRTHYLLTGNARRLAGAFLRQALTDPLSILAGLALCGRLVLNARGRVVPHAAYLLQAVDLLRRMRAAGIAHVHAHFSTNTAALAMLAARMGKVSFSFTAHGPDEFLDTDRASLPLKTARASFVVAISDYCRATLQRLGGGDPGHKIQVARCGLHLRDFDSPARPAAESADLVCVGRLCPQKGQVLLPRVAAALRGEFPDLRFILIGDGQSRGEIESLIERHGVDDMVTILGWRSNDEVRRAIAHARALILPSYAEGLPIVILEALALRRPVVTTAIAGIPELVDEGCGWVVPAGCEQALIEAVRGALCATPQQLDEMGREGRARVERLHDVRDLAATLQAAFERAVAAPSYARPSAKPRSRGAEGYRAS